jgi:hypothetical protein
MGFISAGLFNWHRSSSAFFIALKMFPDLSELHETERGYSGNDGCEHNDDPDILHGTHLGCVQT